MSLVSTVPPASLLRDRASDGVKTGEAVSTKAGRLAARRVLHTVGPKYSEKYQVAAENALYSCYRDCLGLCVEEKLRSVAFPCIYTRRKKYPRAGATQVALRTIRRFMEKHGDSFDAIVLCVDEPEDYCLYEAALPLYFPRTKEQVRSVSIDIGARLATAPRSLHSH